MDDDGNDDDHMRMMVRRRRRRAMTSTTLYRVGRGLATREDMRHVLELDRMALHTRRK